MTGFLIKSGVKYPNNNKFVKNCYLKEINKLLESTTNNNGYVFGDFVHNYIIPSLTDPNADLVFTTLDLVFLENFDLQQFIKDNFDKLIEINNDNEYVFGTAMFDCKTFILNVESDIAVVRVYDKIRDHYSSDLLFATYDSKNGYILESYYGENYQDTKSTHTKSAAILSQAELGGKSTESMIIKSTSRSTQITKEHLLFIGRHEDYLEGHSLFEFNWKCSQGWTIRCEDDTAILTTENIVDYIDDLILEESKNSITNDNHDDYRDDNFDQNVDQLIVNLSSEQKEQLGKFDILMSQIRSMFVRELSNVK